MNEGMNVLRDYFRRAKKLTSPLPSASLAREGRGTIRRGVVDPVSQLGRCTVRLQAPAWPLAYRQSIISSVAGQLRMRLHPNARCVAG